MHSQEKQGFQATQEEIEAWKKKHGGVYEVEAKTAEGEIKRAYIKRPGRNELDYAASIGAKTPLKFNAAILDKCWLSGDDEIRYNDYLFMGVCGQLDQVVETAEATIKKL
jgi:hypothetical protein